jgi:hypothetical protein
MMETECSEKLQDLHERQKERQDRMIHTTEKDNARALGMAMGAMMRPKERWHGLDRGVVAIRA